MKPKIHKQIPWNKGKKLSELHKKRLSDSHKGQIPWFVKRGIVGYTNKGTFQKGGRMPSAKERQRAAETLRRNLPELRARGAFHSGHGLRNDALKGWREDGGVPWNKGIKSHVKPWLGKKRPDISGENCYNWKGGITPLNHKIRTSTEYRDWRTAVFKRDDYTCQECGSRGYKLHADHIKPFAYFPELRLVIENGRTLCVECHRKTPTYGRKAEKMFAASINSPSDSRDS